MDLNLILTVIAISTMGPFLGSLIGVIKYPSKRFMCNMLSFAAGVMLAISFLELIPESIHISSVWICVAGIAFGALVMYGLDRFIPHMHPEMCSKDPFHRLRRTATYILIGIFLHNFPEGMAMAIGGVTEIRLSLIVAIAIAIHDIPEGICTSAPYFHVTKKRMRSFLISFSTAIPTIAGFLLAYFMYQLIPLWAIGFVIAATAGLMIFISSDELIPISSRLTTSHSTIFSFLAGVVFVILLGLL
jgi:ZIP family zinc transporter